MNTEFNLLNKTVSLHRWPLGQKNRSLQAWDSADQYLIEHVVEHQLLTKDSKILIINESFGALSCYFHDYQPFILLDSYVSMQGIEHNLKINQLATGQNQEQNQKQNNVTFIPSSKLTTDNALPQVDLVLIKIPKNNGYLAAILAALANQHIDTTIIGAGKTTDIHNSTLKLFEQYIGTTTTSLAKKKSRLIFSQLENKAQQKIKPRTWPLKCEKDDLIITNHPNVFSSESLDIGARLFIEHLPNCDDKTVVDLGCGNGVISATVMKLFAPKQVKLVDESFAAVKSAQDTIENNFATRASVCEFIVDDCLTKQENNCADVVLCNPPFHQQQAVTDHIAWQMFKDAHRVLRPGGLLCIVGNRNLGYHIKLKRLFGQCEQVASNKKFVILQSKKEGNT